MAELQHTLAQDARAGDPAAWDALFQRYQLPLYAYVFELVSHEQDSLDIIQETFIAATRHIGSLRDDARFGSWLFGIAHQKCLQLWRQRDRRKVVLMEEEPAASAPENLVADGPLDLLLRQEQEAAFLKLLERLPLPQRSVLMLYFLEDFPIEEIARITETPPGTVKSRLHYAKRALKQLLEETPL